MSADPVRTAVGRLAEAQRKDRPSSPERVAAARNELVVARTERAILLAISPEDKDYAPISVADRHRLANILLGGN